MRTFPASAILVLACASFGAPLAAQSNSPGFLFLLEQNGTSIGTVHVFSLNSSSGALTEAPGSPFNAGLQPKQLVADPTGRFAYVVNEQSEDITEYSIDPSTGALTELPGSPVSIGNQPVTIAVDPTGRFLYAFAVELFGNNSRELLYEYTIDPLAGVLTLTSSSPTVWEPGAGLLINSVVFNSAGNIAYLGQTGSSAQGAPIIQCAVDFETGVLSGGAQVQPASGEADHLALAPNGSFLFSVDTPAGAADGFAVLSPSGRLQEIAGAPFGVQTLPNALIVHPSGNFLYVVNGNHPYQPGVLPSQYDGSVSVFTINSSSGTLSQIRNSPIAAGINPAAILIDPTGQFTYVADTSFPSGTTGFAQILGYSINPSLGSLSPFLVTPWTDSAPSNAQGMALAVPAQTQPNPTPVISTFSPASTTATGTGFTLQVSGSNFVPGATVYFGGQPRKTTFVNSGELTANILGSDIEDDGMAVVFVFNPLPGGGASTSLAFPVSSPTPGIVSLNPVTVPADTVGFTMTVTGSGFVESSVVNFNGTPVPTNFGNTAFLGAAIPPSALATPGAATVSVTNPSNGVPGGGGDSNLATFTILAPAAPLSVTSIFPTSAMAGGAPFSLSVTGTGFVQASQVSFNLTAVPTTFVNTTQLTAAIPASAIATASNPYVIVTNPGGATSAQVNFTVNNPVPNGGSVSPPSASAGSNALILNITGTGFVQGSVVFVSGTSRATTFVNATLLQATLLPADLEHAGTLQITIVNPAPGGGTSAALAFSVVNPQPALTSISPTNLAAGSTSLTLSLAGTGFEPDSAVLVGGSQRTTTYESPTSLQAALQPGDVAHGATLNVAVLNPAPGGGTSAVQTLMITDYSIGATAASDTVTAGQTASFALTLSSSTGTFPNPVTFAISSGTPLPSGAAATFSPPSPLTPPQNVTLAITTTPHTEGTVSRGPRRRYTPLPLFYAVVLTSAFAGVWLVAWGESLRRFAPPLTLLFLLGAASLITACGSVGAGNSGPNPSTGTPAGTYSITVLATSGGVSHSTTVTLTVM